jgi:PAS domain S-box-containing protein
MTAIQTSGSWLRSLLKNAATAVLLTAGATGLRACFSPALGSRVPFLIFTLAVAVTAQIAGAISGLAVTGLSAFLIYYPAPTSDTHMTTVLVVFGAVGAVLSLVAGRGKRAEQEHRRIRYNLETAEIIANIGSWESDLGENLWWSPQTYSIFGMESGDKLRSNDFYDRVHPEDKDRVREAARLAMQTNNDYEIEHRIVRASDGDIRFVRQQAKVVENVRKHLIGSIKDVTDKRRGEMAQEILSSFVHVCSVCRRIRDDSRNNEWCSMDSYLHRHSRKLSHGMCTECAANWLSEGPDGHGQKW